MADYKKYVVKGVIHVELELEAIDEFFAKTGAQEGITKILTEHRLNFNHISYHEFEAKEN